jgi:hypothetical protein
MQQFLGWTLLAREKAMLLIRDSKGDLPDEPSGGSRRPPFCAGSKGREGRSAKGDYARLFLTGGRFSTAREDKERDEGCSASSSGVIRPH